MPQKIRELKKQLQQMGFQQIAGKDSHTNWIHPLDAGKLTVSGQDGKDAKSYQEKSVREAIQEVQQKQVDD